jgi:hypothetical protein
MGLRGGLVRSRAMTTARGQNRSWCPGLLIKLSPANEERAKLENENLFLPFGIY